MNRAELRTRILLLLNEDTSSPSYFTTTQIDDFIQEAMETIVEEVTDLRKEAFIVLEPGRWLYSIHHVAPDVMTPFRVWSDAEEERLDVLTMEQLDAHREEWMLATSERPDWWYPVSHDLFGVWPAPTQGGTVLRVDYLAWPEALTADTSSPILRETEQDLILLYGQYEGLIRQWEIARAVDLFSQFTTGFRDQRYKNETRRFSRMYFNRESDGSHFSRP